MATREYPTFNFGNRLTKNQTKLVKFDEKTMEELIRQEFLSMEKTGKIGDPNQFIGLKSHHCR